MNGSFFIAVRTVKSTGTMSFSPGRKKRCLKDTLTVTRSSGPPPSGGSITIESAIGEGADGTWTIICQDLSEGAQGVLTEWRVEIAYDDAVAADATTWTDVKGLYR